MPVYLYHFAFRSPRRRRRLAAQIDASNSISDGAEEAVAAIKQHVARAVHGAGDAFELVVHHRMLRHRAAGGNDAAVERCDRVLSLVRSEALVRDSALSPIRRIALQP